MFAALDNTGNKVLANSGKIFTGCKCLECGNEVIHKARGKVRVPHFAHKADYICSYGKDKDNKCEWHRHMQELFPEDTNEVRFDEKDTNEVRIADVYLKDTKTVIEFQNSPIDCDEFEKRTLFHINHGRHVVWIFNEKGKKESEYGKFRMLEYRVTLGDPCHGECNFQWTYSRRKTLEFVSLLKNKDALQSAEFSICVDYGEKNTVHRIIAASYDYSEVCFSVHPIVLDANMDSTEFFKPEEYWLSFSPWKEMIERSQAKLDMMKQEREKYEKQKYNNFLRGLGL